MRAAGEHLVVVRLDVVQNTAIQIAGRPVGVLLGIDTALNPFSIRPSYQAVLKLPVAERIARLRDPAMRAQILSEKPSEK
jgi:N-acyl-D-amino-acid deacylase